MFDKYTAMFFSIFFTVFALILIAAMISDDAKLSRKDHQANMSSCLAAGKKQYVWQLGCIDEGLEIKIGGGKFKDEK